MDGMRRNVAKGVAAGYEMAMDADKVIIDPFKLNGDAECCGITVTSLLNGLLVVVYHVLLLLFIGFWYGDLEDYKDSAEYANYAGVSLFQMKEMLIALMVVLIVFSLLMVLRGFVASINNLLMNWFFYPLFQAMRLFVVYGVLICYVWMRIAFKDLKALGLGNNTFWVQNCTLAFMLLFAGSTQMMDHMNVIYVGNGRTPATGTKPTFYGKRMEP